MLNDVKTDFTENRRKTVTGDDIYGGRISKSVEKMEKSEQRRHVSSAGCKDCMLYFETKNCRLTRSSELAMNFWGVLYRILPTDLMLRLLAMIYG